MPSVVVPTSLPELGAALRAALVGPPDDAPVVALQPLLHEGAALPAGGGLVVRTSGSTGTPREVVLPRAALRASIDATARRLGGHGRWLLALPWEHVAGAQVVARAVVSGAARQPGRGTTGLPCAALPDGPFTPDAFARAAEPFLDADGAPAYLSLVPTQLHRVLTDAAAEPAGPDTGPGRRALAALRRFDAVLLGGAAVPPDLLARARDAGVRVVTTYGMSETCGGCVYDGRPLDGVRVELDGDGRVLLHGPMVAAGYLGDPDATAAAFGGTAADPDRSFRTSDLGTLTADGRLRVLGRADDVVVTGGEKVAPLAVEHALTAADDLWRPPLWARGSTPEVCVVGVPDAEWGQAVVAVVVDPSAGSAAPAPDALRTAVRAAVAARLSPRAAPRHVVLVPSLPLRGPGKIDRTGLAALVREVVVRAT